MQWLAALSVRRPVFATVLILSLTVVGAFSFMRLGVDRFPKVDFPTVVITTIQPGAAPEQIETEITDKIEEAVNTISGIDELRSVSSEGVSLVIVAFLLDKDADVAAQEVRDKVNGVLPLLPRNIEQPRVEKFDPDAAPVLSIAVSANKPVRDVTEYADKVLRRQLESVTGVGQVLVLGGRQRQINVWLDADRLRAYNLTVTDVSRALQAQNIEIPGGRVDQGAQSVTLRTRGRVQTVAEFGDIVVREKDGHPVRVGDVARVEDGEAEPTTIANVDGEATVLLQHPAPVRHQHRRGRQRRQGAAGRTAGHAAARLLGPRRPRPRRVHRGLDQRRRGAPGRRLDSRGARRLLFLWNLRSTLIAADRDPDVDHRDLRPHLVHGLHAQHDDDARADARRSASSSTTRSWCWRTSTGSSRRRSSTRSRRRSRRRRRSAWRCWRPRCRSWPSSCPSASWAASSAGS